MLAWDATENDAGRLQLINERCNTFKIFSSALKDQFGRMHNILFEPEIEPEKIVCVCFLRVKSSNQLNQMLSRNWLNKKMKNINYYLIEMRRLSILNDVGTIPTIPTI